MGADVIKEFTRAKVADQVRRMAMHLQHMGNRLDRDQGPGSQFCRKIVPGAWWLMSDLGIWMAGYVSVPLYPTLVQETIAQILTHSEARACFIDKLDGWKAMKIKVIWDD